MELSEINKIGMQMEVCSKNTYQILCEKSKILNEAAEKIADMLISKNCMHRISFLSDEISMILFENLKQGDKFKLLSKYLTKDQIKFISNNHANISSLYDENVAFDYKISKLNSLFLYIKSIKKYDITEVGVELGFHNETNFEDIPLNLNQGENIFNEVSKKIVQVLIRKNLICKISIFSDENIIILFENLKQGEEFKYAYNFLNERQKELISQSLYDDDISAIHGKELVFKYKLKRLNNLLRYLQYLNLITLRTERN